MDNTKKFAHLFAHIPGAPAIILPAVIEKCEGILKNADAELKREADMKAKTGAISVINPEMIISGAQEILDFLEPKD